MQNYKLRASVLAVASMALLGVNGVAHADATDELLKKLRDKGILTQDEYDNFNATRDVEKLEASKERAAYKNKLVLGDYINSITPTGDIRARYEVRKAEGIVAGTTHNGYEKLDRARYAWHLGVKTTSDNDFFTELRFASNQSARSPNVDFSSSTASSKDSGGPMFKGGAALVDRAYIGWKATDWMTLIAGRQENQLYTTSMVWDRDLTPEGLSEKFNTKFGNVDVFANLGQYYLKGKFRETDNNGVTTKTDKTAKIFPVQIGAHYQISDESSVKVAPALYSYAGKGQMGVFSPGNGTGTGNSAVYGVAAKTVGINNLQVLEIPAEYNWSMSGLSFRVFGDYANNLQADDRAKAAGFSNKGDQDSAVMVGLQFGSKLPLKTWEAQSTYWGDTKGMKKHDWSGRVWYQRIEAFALDPNLIDSDIMNAQVNLQGFAASGIYMLSDNAFATVTGAHANRIDSSLGTGASVDTSTINATKTYNLLQMDVTWKF